MPDALHNNRSKCAKMTQERKQSRSIAIAGLVLMFIGLLIAVFYAVLCRYDVDTRQLSDLTFVVLGISVQLLGLGLIFWKKQAYENVVMN